MEKSRVYGGRCGELLATCDLAHGSSSWKMLQTSFDWAAPMLLEVLPKSGMTASGRLYPLNNLERHTFESGGFVLDMPPQCLTRDGVLPTPTATGTDHRHQYSQGGRPLLHMLLKGLPTPNASNYKHNPLTPGRHTGKHQKCLNSVLGQMYLQQTNQTLEEAIGKQLRVHPHFVEWMMGFPIGWTD